MRIAHIISPVIVNKISDLEFLQDAIFKSLNIAKSHTKREYEIEQFTRVVTIDKNLISNKVTNQNELKGIVLDLQNSSSKIKLDLLRDLLESFFENNTSDYVIYTRSNICIKPVFYNEIVRIIETGCSSFAIKNRISDGEFSSSKQLNNLINQEGIIYDDYACFVFRYDDYKKFNLGDICIGARWIDSAMICNLMAFQKDFKLVDNLDITIMNSESIKLKKDALFAVNNHNEKELLNILSNFLSNFDVNNRDRLFDLYNQHLNTYYLNEGKNINTIIDYKIDDNIINFNKPTINIQNDNEPIYHNEYRPNGDWFNYDTQIIRQDPVFIIGYPRSGTTLIQSLLATQKDLATFHETHFFTTIFNFKDNFHDNVKQDKLEGIIQLIRERISLSTNAETQINKLVNTSGISFKMLFEIIIIDNLLHQHEFNTIKKLRWIEKTPDHALFIDGMASFYPKAKFIYVVRHPEKSIISRKKNFLWSNESQWPIEKHIDRWQESIMTVESYNLKNPGTVLFVKMENVVTNTQKEINQICNFLEIPFRKENLDNYKVISKNTTYPWESWKKDAALDISQKKVDRRAEHLSVLDRIKIKRSLKRFLELFDYSIEFDDLVANNLLDAEFENQLLEISSGFKHMNDLAKIKAKIITSANDKIKEKDGCINRLKTDLESINHNQQKQKEKSQEQILSLKKTILDHELSIATIQDKLNKVKTEKGQVTIELQDNLKREEKEKIQMTKSFQDKLNKEGTEKEKLIEILQVNLNKVEIEKRKMITCLQDSLKKTETEKENVLVDLGKKNEVIRLIFDSNSWKIGRTITRPLRFVKNKIKN